MTPKMEEAKLPKDSDEEIRQDPNEYQTHSFIVKVWLEEREDQRERQTWRGRITHVPDGERRYLQDLREIARFIAPYLERMGVRPRLLERFMRWISL
jgi:hypothetical protein